MERQNLRTASASMQVLARDKSVDRGIGEAPDGPTEGLPYTSLGLRSPGRAFALRLCFWFCSCGWVLGRLPGRAAQLLDWAPQAFTLEVDAIHSGREGLVSDGCRLHVSYI